MLPRATVRRSVRCAGKVVDVLVEVRELMSKHNRLIAVECKDYSRPLSRTKTAQILSDYWPCLENGSVSTVLLVTRHGIVANAEEMFDGTRIRHLTLSELLTEVLDPASLVDDMMRKFEVDGLSEYYEPAKCRYVNIAQYDSLFDEVWNPFTDYVRKLVRSRQVEFLDLQDLQGRWLSDCRGIESIYPTSYTRDQLRELPKKYTNETLLAVLELEAENRTVDLEKLVSDWLRDDTLRCHIALLGSYGTGKSSFATKLANTLANAFLKDPRSRIPLLIELRHFTTDHDIGSLVTHELVNHHGMDGVSFTRFQYLNALGRFVIILDGFDEMKQALSREALVHSFGELNKLAVPGSKILLCGRPTLFTDEIERREFLGSSNAPESTGHVRYIPVEVAPTHRSRVIPLVRRYASSKSLDNSDELRRKLDLLEAEFRRNGDLRELLSRPLHIPMLLRALPTLGSDFSSLTRATLYENFIAATISREAAKRRGNELQLSGTARIDFASLLACEMILGGDARSIPVSSIPEELVERFRPSRRFTLEVTRRELVAACMLEFRPPDTLVFGHKSYCEYLAARGLLLMTGHTDGTRRYAAVLSGEVLSFAAEICSSEAVVRMLRTGNVNAGLLRALIAHSARDSKRPLDSIAELMMGEFIIREVMSNISSLDDYVLYEIAEMGERLPREVGKNASYRRLLLQLSQHDSDLVAVHAFRALPAETRGSTSDVAERIGTRRFERWQSLGWLQRDA